MASLPARAETAIRGIGRRFLAHSGCSGSSHSPRPLHTQARPARTRPAHARPAQVRPARVRPARTRPVRRLGPRKRQRSARRHDAGTPLRRWRCCRTNGSASGHAAASAPTPDAVRVPGGTPQSRPSNYAAWSGHACRRFQPSRTIPSAPPTDYPATPTTPPLFDHPNTTRSTNKESRPAQPPHHRRTLGGDSE